MSYLDRIAQRVVQLSNQPGWMVGRKLHICLGADGL